METRSVPRTLRLAAVVSLLAGAPAAATASTGSVVTSKHNLSTTGPGTIRSTTETQVCVFCHTPHNANPAPQLWNHQTNSAQTYGTYGSSSFESGTIPGTFNTFPGRSAGQPTGSSRLCLSCHDGTIALGGTLNNGTIALTGTSGGFIPASTSVGIDLSNDHPVSFVRTAGAPQVQDPATGDPVRLETGTGYVQCVTCHDPHREDADPTTRKFLVKANARSALCTTCHLKSGSGWAWSSSPHSTSTKTYTQANTGGTPGLGAHTGYTTVADNACASCHRSHTAPQAQRLVKSVNQRNLCFQCHGSAPVTQKSLATVFAKARTHPLESSTATILHDYAEASTSPTNFSGSRRHVDCADCHNPHGVANAGSPGTGLHAVRTNAIGATSVLAGVTGVEPAAWPAVLPRDGSFPMTSAAQAGYAVSPSSPREYLICFKCHSSYAYGPTPPPSPSGGTQTDTASDFNPGNRGYHPVIGAPRLRVPASNLVAPWNATTSATRMYCSDCHGNNETTSASVAQGPHGSANAFLLRFANATWSASGPSLNQSTGFCYNCHSSSTISNTNNVHGVGAHQSSSCQTCHSAVPHGSFRPALIALAKDPAPYNLGAARLERFQYASSPTGYQESYCYSSLSPCHNHNNTSWAPTTNANTYY
jgi:predicted CXXCH cytochrome family protein